MENLREKDAELEEVLAKLGVFDLADQIAIMEKLGIEPKSSKEIETQEVDR